MSNVKKLIFINMLFLFLVNICIYVYFNITDYKSKIIHRINFNLNHLNHEYTDLNLYQKVPSQKIDFLEYDINERRFLLMDFINFIYLSGNFQILKNNYNVSKVLKGTQVDENKKQESGLLQVQLILDDTENHYLISEEISVFLEKIIIDYNKQVLKNIEIQKNEFSKELINSMENIRQFANKALTKDLAKYLIYENLEFYIKNLDNENFFNFLKISKKKFDENPKYFDSDEFLTQRDNLIFLLPSILNNTQDTILLDEQTEKYIMEYLSILDIEKAINNNLIDEYYRFIFTKKFPSIRELTKNDYNSEVLKNFGIELQKNFKINSSRLNPSKQNLHLSISILLIGFINLIYIIIFKDFINK